LIASKVMPHLIVPINIHRLCPLSQFYDEIDGGIKPAEIGFNKVTIEPYLSDLTKP